MSRSNDSYWGVCYDPIGEDGLCSWHSGFWLGTRRKCIPSRTFATRRGLFTRTGKFPSYRRFHQSPPPKFFKRYWNKKYRRLMDREVRLYGEIISDPEKYRAGLLWDWY